MTKSLFLDWMRMMCDFFYFFPATLLPLLSTQPGEACTDNTQGERDKQKYLTTRYLGKHLTTHVACHMDWIYCFFFMQPPPGEGGSEVTPVQCLPPVAQEVVDEFALRYAIDPIYRMMV